MTSTTTTTDDCTILYNALGADRASFMGFNLGDNCCAAGRNRCDANQMITTLDLTGHGLSGLIPSGLSNLRNLRHIWANNNNFTGNIPIALADMKSLEYVYFENCSLSGAVSSKFDDVFIVFKITRNHFKDGDFSARLIARSKADAKNIALYPQIDDTRTTTDIPKASPATNIEPSAASSTPSGLIVGVVVGLGLVLMIAAISAIYYFRTKKRDPKLPPPSKDIETAPQSEFLTSPATKIAPKEEPTVSVKGPLFRGDVKGRSILFDGLGSETMATDYISPVSAVNQEQERLMETMSQKAAVDVGLHPNKFLYMQEQPECPVTMDTLPTLDITQTGEWLHSCGIGEDVLALLKEKGVDGYQLMIMTDARLIEIGMTSRELRQVLLFMVDRLRTSGASSASGSYPGAEGNAPPIYHG